VEFAPPRDPRLGLIPATGVQVACHLREPVGSTTGT
jgi:hypothetical protein